MAVMHLISPLSHYTSPPEEQNGLLSAGAERWRRPTGTSSRAAADFRDALAVRRCRGGYACRRPRDQL